MSVKVMGLVWDLDGLTSSQKLVLLAYADHADHNGKSIFPSVELISKKTSLSERTVQRTTRDLEEMGLLVSSGKHKSGTNLWSIPIPDMGGDMVTPLDGGHADTPDTVTPGGVTLTTQKGDTVTPDPSLTDHINRQEEEATTSYLKIDPIKILADSSGLVDFPNTYSEYKETVIRLAEQYGIEKTTDAMKNACNTWVKTKNKNGRNYFRTNLGWIDWAQESLLGGELPKQNRPLTAAEKIELERQRILAEQE